MTDPGSSTPETGIPAPYGTTFLGVRLSHPRPLDSTYMPLRPGVHALYGPNGIGKSKVLQGIAQTLRLEPVPPGLSNNIFLRTSPDTEEDPAITTSLRSDISRSAWIYDTLSEVNDMVHEFEMESLQEIDSEQLVEIRLRLHDHQWVCALKPSVAEEIAGQNLFSLTTTSRGNSTLGICVEERTASTDLRDLIAHAREGGRLWKRGQAGDETARLEAENWATELEGEGGLGRWARHEHAPSWAPKDLGEIDDYGPVSFDHFQLAVLDATAEVTCDLRYRSNTFTFNDLDAATRFLCSDGPYHAWPAFLRGPSDEQADELELFEAIKPRLEHANHLYETIVGTPIKLTLDTGNPRQRVAGSHPRIAAVDAATGSTVPVGHLSATQARWAQIAFYLGAEDEEPRPNVVLIDEPEMGLPLGKQRRISQGLVNVSKELQNQIIVATHSASLLNDPAVTPYQCSRNDDGHLTVNEVSTSDRNGLATLKIPISEELHLVRVVLVVEGQHEAVIFDELFGDEISRHRIKVLPIRGTRQLKHLAASGELLFTYLEAPFVLLTDKTRSGPAQQALSAAAPHRTGEEAKKAIDAVFEPQSDEEQVVRAVLYRAAESGHIDRIKAVHGLEADDVLEYLPCDHFVPDATWGELKGLHANRGSREANDFKKWLELEHGAEFDDDNIRSAVQLLDSIPTEFTNVINTCGELSTQAGTSQ